MSLERQCRRCQRTLPIHQFNSPNGQTTLCDECKRGVSPLPQGDEPHRVCPECGAPRPLSAFVSDPNVCDTCLDPATVKARAELARRALLRKSLIRFVSEYVEDYEAGWVHKLVCAKLEKFAEDVRNRKSPRLMLFLPPRSGKSAVASKMFPAWYMGHEPKHEIIACSYAVALPMDFSKRVKEVINSESYQAIFPSTKLDPNSTATEGWKLTKGGAYVAAGVAGPITGKGAHVLIIDDPVKDAEEADSETVRAKTWSWYGSTARTRLAPGGGILLVMTRWHDDDLAGKLLREERERRREIDEHIAELRKQRAELAELARAAEAYQALENWEVISFEALATNDEYWDLTAGTLARGEPPKGHKCRFLRYKGEALHPERFDRNALLRLKNTLQPRHWSALYGQNPTPDAGSFFQRFHFRYYKTPPRRADLHVYCTWDLAIGQRTQNDWTVGLAAGLDPNGDLWLLDMVRARMEIKDIAEAVVDLHVKHHAVLTGIERGQLELALRPDLELEMDKREVIIALAEGDEALVPITDKVVRARPAQGLYQRGKVHHPHPDEAPWVEVYEGELLRFPLGVNDDCVDAGAWMVRMTGAQPRPKPAHEQFAPKPAKSWKDKLKAAQGRKHYMAA